MRRPRQKPSPRKSNDLVTVELTLPKAFVEANQHLCEDINITLAEAIRFVAEVGVPQQFEDEGMELDLLRHVLRTRPRGRRP